MSEYFISVKTCTGQAYELPILEGRDPYTVFATYGDLLFTGEAMLPAAAPEHSHPIQVALAYAEPSPLIGGKEKVILVASCYLICEHDIEVDHSRRATSALLTGQF